MLSCLSEAVIEMTLKLKTPTWWCYIATNRHRHYPQGCWFIGTSFKDTPPNKVFCKKQRNSSLLEDQNFESRKFQAILYLDSHYIFQLENSSSKWPHLTNDFSLINLLFQRAKKGNFPAALFLIEFPRVVFFSTKKNRDFRLTCGRSWRAEVNLHVFWAHAKKIPSESTEFISKDMPRIYQKRSCSPKNKEEGANNTCQLPHLFIA